MSLAPSTPIVSPDRHVDLAIDDALDFETAALIARLALQDLDEILRVEDENPRDELQLQRDHYRQLLASVDAVRHSLQEAQEQPEGTAASAAPVVAFLDEPATVHISIEQGIRANARASSSFTDEDLRRSMRHPEPSTLIDEEGEKWYLYDSDSDPAFELETSSAALSESDISTSVESFIEYFDPSTERGPVAGPSVDRRKSVECMRCYDSVRYMDSLAAPCGHYYCQECTTDFVAAFIGDESLFPLRCCQQRIPMAEAFPLLSDDLRALFEEKNSEFSVPSSDRVYCANQTCSKFLGSSDGSAANIICPECEAATCLECRQPAHRGEDCPVNVATQRLNALAKEKGWQTCPGCHAIVELNLGCFHIICRCQAQFCYLCGERWKTCQCPQFEETRLLNAA